MNIIKPYAGGSTLTAEQLAERKTGLGGTDAKRVMDGDWLALFEEKTGRREPVDLSDVFPVHMGIWTEELNLRWLARMFPYGLITVGTIRDDDRPFMLCHPDAIAVMGHDEKAVIDAKHVNGWSKPEQLVERYYWQGQHNMLVCGINKFVLSPIYGNVFGDQIWIDADPEKQAELLERCTAFWWHVENDTPPNDAWNQAIEAPKISLDDMKTYDFEGNNAWANHATDFTDNEIPAKTFETAKKAIKKLIPDDAREVTGHGIIATRAKNGAITIKPHLKEEAA